MKWCADYVLLHCSYLNPRIPISLSTHLSDVYLTELNAVLSSITTSSSSCPLPLLLEPFADLISRTPTPVVFTRIMDTLFIPLFKALSAGADSAASAAKAASASEERGSKKRKTASGAVSVAAPGTEGYEAIISHSTTSPPSTGGKAGAAAVKQATLKMLFNLAAREEARDANRRKVYIVWNEMGGADGAEGEDGDEDEDW